MVHSKTSWYDTLRAIATIGVIGIHVSSDYQPQTGSISEYDFWIGNIYDSISRFSVPNSKYLNGWGWYLVGGLLSLAMGIYLVVKPDITMAILPYVVGFTVMFRSFQLLGFSFDLKDVGILGWGNLAVLSVLGIILSFMLVVNPLFSGTWIVVLTALSFIFVGSASIVLAFDLKKLKDYPEKLSADLKNKIDALGNEIDNEMK